MDDIMIRLFNIGFAVFMFWLGYRNLKYRRGLEAIEEQAKTYEKSYQEGKISKWELNQRIDELREKLS